MEGIKNSVDGAEEADPYQGKSEEVNNSGDEADAYQGKAEGINNSVYGADEANACQAMVLSFFQLMYIL